MVRALSSNLNVHKSKTLFNFSGIKHKVSEKKRNKSKVKRVAVYLRISYQITLLKMLVILDRLPREFLWETFLLKMLSKVMRIHITVQ